MAARQAWAFNDSTAPIDSSDFDVVTRAVLRSGPSREPLGLDRQRSNDLGEAR